MLGGLAAAFRTPDLRKKILFTLGLLAIYRLGAVIPTPGVDYSAIQKCVEVVQDNSLYGLINLFSGGALLQLSIFALGIMPYITASIIIQLLVVVIPRLEALKKEGQSGQAKLTQYTRYLTIALAVLQGTTILTLAPRPVDPADPVDDYRVDCRYRAHHVVRGTDHRPRRRKRYVAAHLRFHYLDHARAVPADLPD